MSKIHTKYKLVNGGLERTNPCYLRCGKGVFMRDAGDFWSCGKCGDKISK
jgi:ribosomal protein S27AE